MLKKIIFWILGIYTIIEGILMFYSIKTNNKNFPIEIIMIGGYVLYFLAFIIVRAEQIQRENSK